MSKVIEQTIWKWEPEKITLFFISQTGHGKPLINDYEYVSPEGKERLREEIKNDNTMYRVFNDKYRTHYVFVIYKKHYNTRDNAAAIQEAYAKFREVYPDQVVKTTNQNKNIFAALKDEENLQFYTRSRGLLSK